MPSRKRKSVSQKAKTHPPIPLLPPEVPEDDVEVSDEDIKYVTKHRKYAGLLSKINTETITKQILGLKSGKKQGIDLEAYYEKKSNQASLHQKENSQTNIIEPADVLPVKTLSGELHYRIIHSKSSPENDKRKARVTKHTKSSLQTVEKDESLQNTMLIDTEDMKRVKKGSRNNKEQEIALKEKQVPHNGKGLSNKSHESALEELWDDISEEERVEQVKNHMAELGTAVLVDPENNMQSLTELLALCTDRNAKIATMAMLSLLAVFKDIVPGYRIRLPTEKELEMQVSKEVKRLRDFETRLLKCYQKYVQILIKSLKSDKMKPATRCLSGLIEAIPHFNFRDSLLSVLVPLMDSPDGDCRKMSFHAVKSIFQNDGKHGGLATVEAVEMIADLVKQKECMLQPDVVEVLQALSFDEDLHKSTLEGHEESDASGASNRSKHKKKEKKIRKFELAAKLREEVEADFKESSALPDGSTRKKLQTQTMTAVFETYFRILKSSLASSNGAFDATVSRLRPKSIDCGPRPLLRPCLDGLAKFSHFVSVEFMADLLAVLKRLASDTAVGDDKDTVPLSLTEQLHCCVVAFKIVRSNLDALNIDLRDFYVSLYNLLLGYNLVRKECDGLVLAEALEVMLWENRQHDMQRVASFIKRLTTMCLQLGSAEGLCALVTVRHLLQRYRKCYNLLECDEGGGSLAVYQREGTDPDLNGGLSSTLWEISLLTKHYHPDVAKLASQISNMASTSVDFATLSPKDAVLLYSCHEGGFHPAVQLPRRLIKKKTYSSSVYQPQALCDFVQTETDQLFLSHFKVLREFKKNELLRKQLQNLVTSIGLYKNFKMKKKGRRYSKSIV